MAIPERIARRRVEAWRIVSVAGAEDDVHGHATDPSQGNAVYGW